MAITLEIIQEWLKRADDDHTHMIIVCDTFDYDDYPVFVDKREKIHDVLNKYNSNNMQQVMEVYNLSQDLDEQIAEHRAFNL